MAFSAERYKELTADFVAWSELRDQFIDLSSSQLIYLICSSE